MWKRLLLSALSLAFVGTAAAQPTASCAPRTFHKHLGSLQDHWTIPRAICPSGDGNFLVSVDWVTKEQGLSTSRFLLMKITPAGEALWSRVFLREDPVLGIWAAMGITHMVTDSEGMLVATGEVGAYQNGQWRPLHFALRYDFAQDTVLWCKHLRNPNVTGGFFGSRYSVVEKSPGGNYLLSRQVELSVSEDEMELMELQRQTGTVVASSGKRLEWNKKTELRLSSVYQGALYHAGSQTLPDNVKQACLLCKTDLTGQPIWAKAFSRPKEGMAHIALRLDQDTLVSLFMGSDTIKTGGWRYVYLSKTTLSGDLLWVKRYEMPEMSGFSAHALEVTDNGYLIVGAEEQGGSGFFLFSTDKSGKVQRACHLPVPAPFKQPNLSAEMGGSRSVSSGSSFYFLGHFEANLFVPPFRTLYEGMLLKTELDLSDSDQCPFAPLISPLVESDVTDYAFRPVPLNATPFTAQTLDMVVRTEADTISERTDCIRCDAPCGPPLSLGPDRELFADTAVLLQAGPGYASYLWNDGSTAPNYAAAPGGTYWVEVTDACGFVQRDTVRLSYVEKVCDRKDLGCLRWELLDVQTAGEEDLRYLFRLTNGCASGLKHIDFQVPSGVAATWPAQQALYFAPVSGRAYEVRNPNFSPFYSVRFKAAGNSPLLSGNAEVFEYRLPAQAQPAYIGSSVRLDDGSVHLALLNTFQCPPAAAMSRIAPEFILEKTPLSSTPLLWPNPSRGELWLERRQGGQVQVRILNAQGQVLQSGQLLPEQAFVLSGQLPNGLYYATLQAENEAPLTWRFMLQR